MPDDDFHMVGRDIPETHIALLNVLSMEWANPLAIHGGFAPYLRVWVNDRSHWK
jgi:hypothetical protein